MPCCATCGREIKFVSVGQWEHADGKTYRHIIHACTPARPPSANLARPHWWTAKQSPDGYTVFVVDAEERAVGAMHGANLATLLRQWLDYCDGQGYVLSVDSAGRFTMWDPS